MILSCWEDQYGRLDTLNVKICQNLLAFLMEAKKWGKSEEKSEEESADWNLIHIEEDFILY